MRRLVYLPAALADLRDIALYIAADDPDRAERFVGELRDAAEKTANRPESFPSRHDLAPGLRAARLGRYLIFFEHAPDEVRIIRVLHGARDLRHLFTD